MRELAKVRWVLLCLLSPWAGSPALAQDVSLPAHISKPQMIQAIQTYLPNSYAKFHPEWVALRHSCEDAEKIVADHADLQRRIDALYAKAPDNDGKLKALILKPEDINIQLRFQRLDELKTVQLGKLDDLFSSVETIFQAATEGLNWSIQDWARKLVDGAREDQAKIRSALEQGDFATCTKTLDEYLGRSS